jgi:hypothetical protein
MRRLSVLLATGALVLGTLVIGTGTAQAAPGGGDAAVSKACPTSVNPGQVYSCVITVTATTATAATGVEVRDQATAGARFQGVSGTGGATCGGPAIGSEGNSINCTFPSVVMGTPQTMTVNFSVNPGSSCKTRISNTATLSDVTAATEANDISTVVTDVECDQPAPGTPPCTIDFRGAVGGQVIRGTEGPDVICGSAYGDQIYGLGGWRRHHLWRWRR